MTFLPRHLVKDGRMLKIALVYLFGAVSGALLAFLYVQDDVERALRLQAASRVVREDQVLVLLEKDQRNDAMRVQAEYLKSSLFQLEQFGNSWPEEIAAVVARRREIASK